MSSYVTNSYPPGSDSPLKLCPFKLQRAGRPRKLDRTDADYKQLAIQPGIAECAKQNKAFKDLLSALQVDLMANKDIVEAYETKYHLRLRREPYSNSQDHHRVQDAPLLTKPELELIYLRLACNWSLNSLSSRFGVLMHRLREVFRVVK